MDEKIDYDVETQLGITTVYSVPVSKKEIPSDIEMIILRKGSTYSGIIFFQVYRGRKLVKQYMGDNAETKAYEYIEKLKVLHQIS